MKLIEKSHWKSFTERVSKGLTGKRAEIEVDLLRIGAQIQAEWVPIIGIAYDHKDNLFEVALVGLDHLIHKPREVYAQEGGSGLELLTIVNADGERHIVKFRDPLMLPAPSS